MARGVELMKPPYSITKSIWEDFRAMQISGKMNMFGHPFVKYFYEYDAYAKAKQHFEVEGNCDILIIEG